jgi:hypothetical protein
VSDLLRSLSAGSPSPAIRERIAGLLEQLVQPGITYFPIRHHSPACARQLAWWMEQHPPATILIEGPESSTRFVELLARPDCRMPVALYISCSLPGDPSVAARENASPTRYGAYFPLCDYSPELVAIRAGVARGAKVRLIDLEFAEKVRAEQAAPTAAAVQKQRRSRSLADDPELAFSSYTRLLCEQLGCRDFHELWDHLFEAESCRLTPLEFIERLGTFCALTRELTPPDRQTGPVNELRERCMAAAIREELQRHQAEGIEGPVLVVTGGFHTVALPELVAGDLPRPARPAGLESHSGTWLIPYSFDRLDALNGYQSGMPAPGFYDALWHASRTGTPAELSRGIVELILDFARQARPLAPAGGCSTPEVQATVEMALQLAALRGHAFPQREDMQDAIRSCLATGELAIEGLWLTSHLKKFLAGDRVGSIPQQAQESPLVADFRIHCQRWKLPHQTGAARTITLELYRSARARAISQFLQRLQLLDVPYASWQGGPDYVRGQHLDRLTEVWEIRWSPATASQLVEALVWGGNLAEAATARLLALAAEQFRQPQTMRTEAAVGLLRTACQLGLTATLPELVEQVRLQIETDAELPSVAAALSQLLVLRAAGTPLQANRIEQLPELIQQCYQRTVRLTRSAALTPADQIDGVLQALAVVRGAIRLEDRYPVS